MTLSRRLALLAQLLAALAIAAPTAAAAAAETRPWEAIVAAARGQTVHFNAW